MRIYNTLSNRIEVFKEIKRGHVGLYTCGPTVYDYPHIGNFRSYVFEDLVKRYFLYRGYKVTHVMNITDIDDKTIKKAKELGIKIEDVTAKYTQAFFKDLDTLNIIRADVYPKATEHIGEMVEMIEILLKKGLAYRKDGAVYFSVEKFPDYGMLANIEKDALRLGVRVDADEYDKDNIQDFVLWKERKPDEPFWETSIGEGRPGWHIECSAMSSKYLGPHFDIHMGGVDNIFPHHENEIAQSQCATGTKFVNYWIHCQHLIIDNQKMSKSLGNYYILQNLLDKGYDPATIRYLLISTHYRKQLNFTLKGLEQARRSLKRIEEFLFSLKALDPDEGETPSILSLIENSHDEFEACLDDDFNISGALGAFFEFIHHIHSRKSSLKKEDVKRILDFVKAVDSVLGVIEKEKEEPLDENIMKKIRLREEARKRKDYEQADIIRDELKAKGIILIDMPDGVKWKIEK